MLVIFPEELYRFKKHPSRGAATRMAVKISTLINEPVTIKEWVGKIHTLEEEVGDPVNDECWSNGLGNDVGFIRDGIGEYHIASHDGLLQNAVVFIRSEDKTTSIITDMPNADEHYLPFEVYDRSVVPQIKKDLFSAHVEIKVYPV